MWWSNGMFGLNKHSIVEKYPYMLHYIERLLLLKSVASCIGQMCDVVRAMVDLTNYVMKVITR
jgi:hypothetical protein